VHAVLCSSTLFALRGGAALAGARWPQYWLVRYASYGIDTVLLTAATMLFSMLPAGLFANGWLTVKLLLLVAYIGLGILAMRPNRTRRQRAGYYLAALTAFASIYGIARNHHPLGWLAGWLG
jgi:uncharacterized membrane protein SirB2